MPFIIDPGIDKRNGVGKTYRKINLTLSIFLPLITILITIYWGYMNGFEKFI